MIYIRDSGYRAFHPVRGQLTQKLTEEGAPLGSCLQSRLRGLPSPSKSKILPPSPREAIHIDKSEFFE